MIYSSSERLGKIEVQGRQLANVFHYFYDQGEISVLPVSTIHVYPAFKIDLCQVIRKPDEYFAQLTAL